MDLLSSYGKKGISLDLLHQKVDIEDTEHLSKYFALVEFNPLFTAGKNAVSFNGSALLRDKSEIQVECIDSKGNSLYLEHAKSINAQYTDNAKFVISVSVFDETYNGQGYLVLVGTTTLGETVRWIGMITIDKTANNSSKVRFYNRPTLEASSLLYPVVDTTLATVQYPPPPAVRQALAQAVIFSRVNLVNVTNAGTGYTVAMVSIDGGGGSGADAVATITGGTITMITVTNPGSGYTSVPTVSISGDGTNAAAQAVLLSTVQNIIVLDGGAGYTSIPTVTISGGGSGATAVATIAGGAVTHISVINPGTGYVVPPDVTVSRPPTPAPPELNQEIFFSASFTTHAANPLKGTNQNVIDPRQTDFDYRVILANPNPVDLAPTTFPYKAFNTQQEGQPITLYIQQVQLPFSTQVVSTSLTQSFTVKKVIDSQTIQLNAPFYYPVGKNNFVAHIVSGSFLIDYRLILYNTNPDSQKTIQVSPTAAVPLVDSYAEILYRNLRPFSGFVARHKLYRKSSFSTGDFILVSDDKLGTIELLADQITFNKFYDNIGVFYHQPHINKYWWPSSNVVSLEAKSSPINSMRIFQGEPSSVDGSQWVMVKNDSIGIMNNNQYYPYNSASVNSFSGQSYNSNFIPLKQNAMYMLRADVIMEKDASETGAKVSFYFTSSIPSIRQEAGFTPQYGMKLGEVSTTDQTAIKYFNNPQTMSFTPQNDYNGTLVVVPYRCNVTLANVSLQVYGDYGFSPDILFIRIPWTVQVKNEAFNIKAELFDINANLVFSGLQTVETFDAQGSSLFSALSPNAVNTVINVTEGDVTFVGNAFFPNLSGCNNTTRFVGWHVPIGNPTVDGMFCYTNVESLIIDSDDYIVLDAIESGVPATAKSVAVRYDFSVPEGRKIFVDQFGAKQTFP